MTSILASRLTIDQLNFKGKRVLARVDYNVPLDKSTLKVRDPKRIVETLKTLNHILDQEPRTLILMSHLGRPKGRANPKLSLKPVVPVLEGLLGRKVHFLNDCIGKEVEEFCANAPQGAVILLENLRFHLAEEGKGKDKLGKKVKADKKDVEAFRAALSRLGDVFVNDAFGTAHRAHSSMVGISVPLRAAGFLLKAELQAFSKALDNPTKPVLAIMGGAKVKDKIQLISNLLEKVDEMIITGAMAFTFKKIVFGVQIGSSLFDQDGAKIVQSLVDKATAKGVKLHFPTDYIIGDEIKATSRVGVADDRTGIPDGWLGLDVGPRSITNFTEVIMNAKTIVFNGPMGVFEYAPFQQGTKKCLEACAAATQRGTLTIIGGGDTAAATNRFGLANQVSHVSTGGGASLELMEGKELPGITFLSDRNAADAPGIVSRL